MGMFLGMHWRKTPQKAVEEIVVAKQKKNTPRLGTTCDGHVDALWVNFKRRVQNRDEVPPIQLRSMKAGGLDSAVFAIFLHPTATAERTRDEIDLMVDWQLSVWRAEYANISEHQQYLGLEGSHLLGHDMNRLVELVQGGLRVLGLCHNYDNDACDSSTDKEHNKGLTEWGHRLCHFCEETGVILDISHASDRSAKQAFDAIGCPIIASHSGVRRLTNHVRNLPDALIKEVAESKGVIGVPYAKNFVTPYQPVDHIDAIVDLCQSVNYVAIGSDLDGAAMIRQCPDVSHWKEVSSEALCKKGYEDHEIQAICGGNLIRVLEGN